MRCFFYEKHVVKSYNEDSNQKRFYRERRNHMSMTKEALPAIVLTAILFSGGTYYYLNGQYEKKLAEELALASGDADEVIVGEDTLVSIHYVEEVLKPAGELITMKVYYKDADTYEHHKEAFGFTLPLTSNKIVFTYEGTISLGVDFTKITYEIDNEEKKITVNLPEVEILANEIDASSFTVPYESVSIFNQEHMKDVTDLIDDLKQSKAEKVNKDEDLKKSALDNAENVISGFLKSAALTKEYTVVFR